TNCSSWSYGVLGCGKSTCMSEVRENFIVDILKVQRFKVDLLDRHAQVAGIVDPVTVQVAVDVELPPFEVRGVERDVAHDDPGPRLNDVGPDVVEVGQVVPQLEDVVVALDQHL